MSNTSAFFDHTLTELVADMDEHQRKTLIEGVFSILESTDNKTFNEIAENWKSNSGIIFKSLKNMDNKTRSLIISTLLNLIKCAKNNFSDINPLRKENRKHRDK